MVEQTFGHTASRSRTYDPVAVRRLRRFIGIRQATLAARVGISRAYMSDIEKGTIRQPSARILVALACELRCTIADLGVGDQQSVRRRRLEAGITQSALARRVGISGAYMSAIENGKFVNPNPEILAAIARELDCDVAELFEGVGVSGSGSG